MEGKREHKRVFVEEQSQIPNTQQLRSLNRTQILTLVFAEPLVEAREELGVKIQEELGDTFNEEIYKHQDFFEKCAKDYRALGTKLIYCLAKYLDIQLCN